MKGRAGLSGLEGVRRVTLQPCHHAAAAGKSRSSKKQHWVEIARVSMASMASMAKGDANGREDGHADWIIGSGEGKKLGGSFPCASEPGHLGLVMASGTSATSATSGPAKRGNRQRRFSLVNA
jgi:hypothetical protein